MSRPARLRAFLFDMDGLLVDTEHVHLTAFANVARAHGVAVGPEHFRPWVGHPSRQVAAALVEEHGLAATPAAVLAEEEREFLRLLAATPPPLLAGVDAMFRSGEALGLRRGLVSSSIREQVHAVLGVVLSRLGRPPELGATFDAIVTGQDVARLKPDPAPYLEACRRLALDPAECLVFEDSEVGVRAARAAGCPTCAIPSPYLDGAAIRAAAHHAFDSLAAAAAARVWESLPTMPQEGIA